jgi:hypothetical protein
VTIASVCESEQGWNAQRGLAHALYARNASDDRTRAEALHGEAETTYRSLGMASWAARCRWDG